MWYYMDGNERRGPVSAQQLASVAAAGGIQQETLIWSEGMSEWQPAGDAAPELFAPPPPVGSIEQPLPATPAMPSATVGASGFGSLESELAGVPNVLPWAIAVTILCCLPGGIASIIYAVRANKAKEQGNLAEAQQAAKTAKMWCWISAAFGLIVTLIVILGEVGSQL